MKRIIIAAVLMLVSLGVRAQFKFTPENGDLLFVGIPGDYSLDEDTMSSAIASSTGDGNINYIHTAILEVDEAGEVYVLDATIKYGVYKRSWESFLKDFTLKDGSLPLLEVYRLKDTEGIDGFLANAESYIGEEYDCWFLPGNDKHYCTELVYDSYIRNGAHIFQSKPMNFKNADGEFPLYWEQLFALIGSAIPQGQPGTNPQDMIKDPQIYRVGGY